MSNPKWLDWAQKLQAHAQNGLTYTQNPFDAQRYREILDLAVEILSDYTQTDMPVMKDLITSQKRLSMWPFTFTIVLVLGCWNLFMKKLWPTN